MLILNFWIKLKNNLIVKYEKMNESIIEKILNWDNLRLSEKNISFSPKIVTTAKVGIASKKDIFKESILLNPKNLAPVIAIPDLLTPGTSERIW